MSDASHNELLTCPHQRSQGHGMCQGGDRTAPNENLFEGSHAGALGMNGTALFVERLRGEPIDAAQLHGRRVVSLPRNLRTAFHADAAPAKEDCCNA